jgi:hypothetical protein
LSTPKSDRAEVAVDLLAKVYHYDQHDMATWAACSDLLPHLTTATEQTQQYGCETDNAAARKSLAFMEAKLP